VEWGRLPVDLERELQIAVRTGKLYFGLKSALKNVKLGRGKLVILASNIREEVKSELSYYARLSSIPVYVFPGSSLELGSLCGKPFMVSAITVFEAGDSEILSLVEEG